MFVAAMVPATPLPQEPRGSLGVSFGASEEPSCERTISQETAFEQTRRWAEALARLTDALEALDAEHRRQLLQTSCLLTGGELQSQRELAAFDEERRRQQALPLSPPLEGDVRGSISGASPEPLSPAPGAVAPEFPEEPPLPIQPPAAVKRKIVMVRGASAEMEERRPTATLGLDSVSLAHEALRASAVSNATQNNDAGNCQITELELNNSWARPKVVEASHSMAAYRKLSGVRLPSGMVGSNSERPAAAGWLTLGWLIVHPSAPHRLIWDMLGMMFLTTDLITVPMQLFGRWVNFNSPAMLGLSLTTSAYWTLDMAFSFLTGFNVAGVVELNPYKVAMHYFKTWFTIDFILVTVDWWSFASGYGSQASYMRIGKTLSRGFRVLRLLRIVKMHTMFADLMDNLRSEYSKTLCSIGGLVLFIITVNHFIACGWYGMTHLQPKDNWALKAFGPDDELGYRYFTALHWSLTQFTPASMEVVPQNVLERMYSVCVLLFAMVTFSSFISSITQAMSNLRSMNARRMEQQGVLRRYLYQHGISANLVSRVWHFLHQREILNIAKFRTKEHDVTVLQWLPEALRVELRVESYLPVLNLHPFFYHFGLADSTTMCQVCHMCIHEVSLPANQELFNRSNIEKGTETLAFFILIEGNLKHDLPCTCGAKQHGERSEDRDGLAMSWDELEKGQWGCEAALWLRGFAAWSSFRALSKSEVLVVNSPRFATVCSQRKGSLRTAVKYAKVFAEYMEMGSSCRWRLASFCDYSFMQDLAHKVFDFQEALDKQDLLEKRKTRRTRKSLAVVDISASVTSMDSMDSSGAGRQEDASSSDGSLRGSTSGSRLSSRSGSKERGNSKSKAQGGSEGSVEFKVVVPGATVVD